MIDFLCPNGHRIRCPADQAGQPAKCPRCGVKFRVPSAEEIELEKTSHAEAGDAPMELTSTVPGGSPAAQARPQKEPQIEFLCPNGHLLHGPASLQGRPGACPECGSRFRIPVIDAAEETKTSPQEQIDLHTSAGADETGGATAGLTDAVAAGSTPAIAQAAPTGGTDIILREPEAASTISAKQPAAPAAPQGHPLAELVAQLWATKDEQAKVELRLQGGDTLAPEHFVKGLSRGAYGVFGVKTGDGNWTLTVVRWDDVERVVLQDIKNLPALLSDNL